MNKRMNIALFIGMVENEFSELVCEGALLGAKEIDANLFILPGGIIDAEYDDEDANYYRYQYNTLFSCAKSKSIDVAIIEYGTITSFIDEKRQQEFLEQFQNVPVILIAGEKEGYSSVCFNNKDGMKETISHLIEEHNCKKIGFVSGPRDNKDAKERLEVYYETLEEHNLEIDDKNIIYGNFSEYCVELVQDFLMKNPDIEALVFANDQMAVGGYQALDNLSLQPGKDIYVTGFDDSPAAMLLEPNLTTVKADPKELAYTAVKACKEVLGGKLVCSEVSSKMIKRQSCGCEILGNSSKEKQVILSNNSAENLKKDADYIFEEYFNIYFENSEALEMKKIVEEYFVYFTNIVSEDGVLDLDSNEFMMQHKRFCNTYQKGYVDFNQLFVVNKLLYDYVYARLAEDKQRLILSELLAEANRELMFSTTKKRMISDEKIKLFEVVLSTITRDMLQFSKEEQKKYETVIEKFRKMEFESSYIFTIGECKRHTRDEGWDISPVFYAKAWHNGDDVHLYKGKEKRIRTKDLFSDKIMPTNRRLDMLVMPLFSGEEQYGLLFTESKLEYFRYAAQIACQVSASMEVIEIIKKQNEIKKELGRNLAKTVANNKVLDEMSRLDPLTDIYNRRGFMDTVKRVITEPKNLGKRAIVVYADMDNLKIINDEFGHDDGDFSLKAISNILKESFRRSDVVGRMGGDEFAAFAITSQKDFSKVIKERIRSESKEFNDNCDKPYFVNMSVGVYEFEITENVNVEHVLNNADTDLYEEKKHKNKIVYK